MTANELYAKLRELAPSVAFSAHKERDDYYTWDGDGAEPDDVDAHNIDVRAETVAGGVLVSGTASLGGCYMAWGEEIGDVGGYLPQMLRDAAEELKGEVSDADVIRELDAAVAFLRQEMRERYDAQRSAMNV
jgi:hypothetical protein